MEAYIYKAGLWCGPCVIKALVAARKAAPGASGMSPAKAPQQIASANEFTCRGDYDSDNLLKGPIAEGGGEADNPRHCEGCGQFLENPLTSDGVVWVEDVIRGYLSTRKVSGATTDTVNEWAHFYRDELDFRRIVLEALEERPPDHDKQSRAGLELHDHSTAY